MNIGMVISTNDNETCWNALRYANFCLSQGDEVKIFFVGKGVEYQGKSTGEFNTVEQVGKFLENRGKIYACGSCIKTRGQAGSEVCPISTMQDMYDIVKESDKVITF